MLINVQPTFSVCVFMNLNVSISFTNHKTTPLKVFTRWTYMARNLESSDLTN